MDTHLLSRYTILLSGLIILLINHVTVMSDNPWLIPAFLQIH